ncbi:hypothetical protein [Azospirillum sp. B4]|uniref:hypothetical protein n=1 Tax=Azospirillum sp. B4 TaxID=95605 RepID=UPI0011DD03F1|nr:hypothetical protein [Azospirillum sp. B4]
MIRLHQGDVYKHRNGSILTVLEEFDGGYRAKVRLQQPDGEATEVEANAAQITDDLWTKRQ